MGRLDQIIRFVTAAILVSLYYTNILTGTLIYVLPALSAIFVLISFISFYPLYTIFGLNTCKIKE